MAFVFPYTTDTLPSLVGGGEQEHVSLVPIGHDDETGATYTLMVALSRTPGGVYGERELVFNIMESDHLEGGTYIYWDGSEVVGKIPAFYRAIILQIICNCLARLADILRPQSIVMQTYGDHLPDKAIVKYQTICAFSATMGYSSTELEPYHGVRMWKLERLAAAND